tara:strand:- start:1107 stop:1733 length:627 start_codon:yes stop_codon:yes gene_type:complete
MISISYSILTHNETDSLLNLLNYLVDNKDSQDEIVILDDYSDNQKTIDILDTMVSINNIVFERRHLKGDFASQKNYLRQMCTKDYIFNIDADEIPHKLLAKNLKNIVEYNSEIELFYVPRINTVEGITDRHIMKWGWNVNEKGHVNWPDWQARLHKNVSHIFWNRNVHETLDGFKTYAALPQEEKFAILHHKTIDRQEKQNEFYSSIR